ncbi:LacI family DNA-binding transcriptional regulator [Rhizobium sp. Root1203]|uniref:LacI family DNA-binding transcriptional regulator n=1 Tax=Rhizobium sp. Root1203 TaxID=1736427 RepID=UPI0009E9906F|nr:LacI family DNA-binding transcriptional regulator [Rhizobium sp. Root1203]
MAVLSGASLSHEEAQIVIRQARRSSGRPTLANAARRAGVGTITVSRALRHPERVSVALRQRITTAINDLGYVLNGRHATRSAGKQLRWFRQPWLTKGPQKPSATWASSSKSAKVHLVATRHKANLGARNTVLYNLYW